MGKNFSPFKKIEIVDELQQMKTLSGEWDALARHFGTPLLLHGWFAACAEALHANDRLSVLMIRSEEELCAIAPMVAVRKGWIEHLELLGASTLMEPGGFIYAGEEQLKHLIHALLATRRPVILRRLHAESIQPRSLTECCKRRALCLFREMPGSLWFEIHPNWKTFDESIPSRRLKRLQRKQRAAERMGRVEYEVIAPGNEHLADYLKELFEVENAGWKGRNGTSILAHPDMEQFITCFSQTAVQNGSLRLFFMRVNGEVIAARMAILYANRLWEIKIGYDEKFSHCSPGLLLTHETIKYAFEQGLEAYEFLGDEESWEYLWTNKSHPYVAAHIYPFSILGFIALGKDLCRFAGKKSIKLAGMVSSFAKKSGKKKV